MKYLSKKSKKAIKELREVAYILKWKKIETSQKDSSKNLSRP